MRAAFCSAAVLLVLALPAYGGQTASATAYTAQSYPLIEIAPAPITKKDFRPFGQLIEVQPGVRPTLANATLQYWSGLAKARIHEQMEFGIFTVQARERETAEMERHSRSPELLVGLEGDSILLVAPRSRPKTSPAQPDPEHVKAFIIRQGQAVILEKGTWHTFPFPLAEKSKFLVGFRDGTAEKDLVTRPYRKNVLIKF